ncbi:hypothetical protein J056_003727 [Wallemia ichthyophaga EXF-994]|uniref:Uncharacterized protein n=1 Tax=Wallemia ichthyophaga (strain EXF-994 / CBS 113033) TaxID=1299270 RepID=R9APM4_WALI9|nr:uncharacterized protein J056_003727 [Wallemia ichthyophaga EXF-994]EOR02051.1 hypothetical protein J056_003727 [Wallemia ichthyophaga EXF-994]
MFSGIARSVALRSSRVGIPRAAVTPITLSHTHRYASGFGSSEQAQLLEKLSKAPKAIEIIKQLSQVMHDKGVEPGSNPSASTLWSLASDEKVKELSQELNNELKEAGIDAKEMVGDIMPGSDGENGDKGSENVK